MLLQADAAAGQPLGQQLHLVVGGAVQHGFWHGDGQVLAGHLQQLLPCGTVCAVLVDLLLLGADSFAHGGQRLVAQRSCKFLGQLRGGLFGDGVELDLELSRFAGQLFDPEVFRIGEVEPERLTGFVAVDGVFGGGHQLAVAQHDHDLLHPAVGDLPAVHVAGKVQQGAEAALGGLVGVVVDRVQTGLVDHLDIDRLFGKAAYMAGDGQTLVLAQLDLRDVVLLVFHFAILLLTIKRYL